VEERNSIWLLFTRPQMQSLLVDWQREVRDILGQFRIAVGQYPDEPRIITLIDTLTRSSSQFRALWSEHPVQAFRPAMKRFSPPTAGRLDLNYTKLEVAEAPGQHLVVFMPATEADERALARLVEEAPEQPLCSGRWHPATWVGHAPESVTSPGR
jgi:hypothetical protein